MLWQLFIEPENIIFSISLCLMLFLGIVECLMMFFGSSSQGFLDQFIPEQVIDLHKPEINIEAPQNIFLLLLDWLYIGRIPMLVWLIIFLTVFSLFGFAFQCVFQIFSSTYLNIWLVTPLCLILSMPIIRVCAAVIARILPRDETTAIYSEELIGRNAIIITGNAKANSPAQAKVVDQFGQTHYVMVEPENELIFMQGETVILSQKTSIGFKAIPPSVPI